MHKATLSSFVRVLCAALVAGAGLAGCGPRADAVRPASTDIDGPVTTAARPGQAIDDSVAHYNAGRYAQAKSFAEAEAKRYRGREREVSLLTAGLAAHALGQHAEAARFLEPLALSRDQQIAGRAEAALGLIAQRKNEHAKAADLLWRAGRKLSGDEAARAAMQSGHSLTTLGQHGAARERYTAAAAAATTDRVRHYAQSLAEPGPFALQVGVFSSKPNADRRAREIGQQTARHGFGLPLVIPAPMAGKQAYSVRVGTFVSRYEAELAKDRLGTQAVVVSAAP